VFRNLEAERDFALRLAVVQGRVIKTAFRRGTTTNTKGDGTVVTETDLLVSRNTVAAYQERGIGVVSEEGGTARYGDFNVAIVDPIDGTKDFVKGQQRRPLKSVAMYSLGLARRELVVGVAYAPLLQSRARLYGAIAGGDAALYDDKLRLFKMLQVASSATKGVVMVSAGSYGQKVAANLAKMGLRPVVADSAVFKAIAVADSGLVRAYDGTLLQGTEQVVGFVSTGTHLHDYAASAVIVRAAGGIATSLNNGPLSFQAGRQGCVMSANAEIHAKLLDAAKV